MEKYSAIEEGTKMTIMQVFFVIGSNRAYLSFALTLSTIYFIITNVQFWFSDYMELILKMDKEHVVMSFSLICITAPTTGALIGSVIINKLGGYNSVNTMPFCLFVGVLCGMMGMPIPFMDNAPLVLLLLWLAIFNGGMLVPILTSLMLSVVQPELRPQATAIANIFYNVFGYIPAPFIYGIVA